MSQGGYIAIAISVIIALLIIFIVSFILYRRTPVPKGCEELKISEEKCSACSYHNECSLYEIKEDKKEEK